MRNITVEFSCQALLSPAPHIDFICLNNYNHLLTWHFEIKLNLDHQSCRIHLVQVAWSASCRLCPGWWETASAQTTSTALLSNKGHSPGMIAITQSLSRTLSRTVRNPQTKQSHWTKRHMKRTWRVCEESEQWLQGSRIPLFRVPPGPPRLRFYYVASPQFIT